MPGAISHTSYSQLNRRLDALIAWLEEHRVRIPATRILRYRRSFDELLQIYESGDEERAWDRFPILINTLFEVHELLLIHEGLGDAPGDVDLRSKLSEISKGPTNYTEEDGRSSNRARNIAFELILASRLSSAGLQLDQTLPTDTACLCNNRTLLFECKRPMEKDNLKRNVKKAEKQLKHQYCNPKRVRSRGIIAVDLSRLSNPESNLLITKSEEHAGTILENLLAQYIDENVEIWRKAKGSKTIGILLRVGIMAITGDGDRSVTYCQQYSLTPLHESGPDYNTVLELGKALMAGLSNTRLQATQ